MNRHELTPRQWERLQPLLPPQKPHTGRPATDHRRLLNGILWIIRTGAPWRDLPERFGDWKQVHTRHTRWAASGVWERVFKVLAADADNEYAMIDSTIVRAHQHSAGARKKTAATRRSGAVEGD